MRKELDARHHNTGKTRKASNPNKKTWETPSLELLPCSATFGAAGDGNDGGLPNNNADFVKPSGE